MKKGAIGIVFSKDKTQVLLIKRRDVPIWVLPGGGIEDQETPENAVKRELLEETGEPVEIVRKIGEYLPINRLATTTFLFECSFQSPPVLPLRPQEESQEIAFFPIDALPRPFFFLHKEWLDDALQHGDAPLSKKIESITFSALFFHAVVHPILTLRYFFSRIGLPINSKSH